MAQQHFYGLVLAAVLAASTCGLVCGCTSSLGRTDVEQFEPTAMYGVSVARLIEEFAPAGTTTDARLSNGLVALQRFVHGLPDLEAYKPEPPEPDRPAGYGYVYGPHRYANFDTGALRAHLRSVERTRANTLMLIEDAEARFVTRLNGLRLGAKSSLEATPWNEGDAPITDHLQSALETLRSNLSSNSVVDELSDASRAFLGEILYAINGRTRTRTIERKLRREPRLFVSDQGQRALLRASFTLGLLQALAQNPERTLGLLDDYRRLSQ